jgi:hypothetical protein
MLMRWALLALPELSNRELLKTGPGASMLMRWALLALPTFSNRELLKTGPGASLLMRWALLALPTFSNRELLETGPCASLLRRLALLALPQLSNREVRRLAVLKRDPDTRPPEASRAAASSCTLPWRELGRRWCCCEGMDMPEADTSRPNSRRSSSPASATLSSACVRV